MAETSRQESKGSVVMRPNVELSGRQRRGAPDSGRKMGRKALRQMAGAPRCWRSA